MVTDILVNDIGLERLDDFRLAPPSLEDVYLQLDRTTVTNFQKQQHHD
jgi:hypothetical protein